MSLGVGGQAQGIVTIGVCGVNGLLCADVVLLVVESNRFQWPTLSRNAEPNFSSLMLGFIRAVRSPDLNTTDKAQLAKKHKAFGDRYTCNIYSTLRQQA
jgi:hypothetical protein